MSDARYPRVRPMAPPEAQDLAAVARRNLVMLSRVLPAFSDVGELHRTAEPLVRAVVARAMENPIASEREAAALLGELPGIYARVYGPAGFPDGTRTAILEAAIWLLAECVDVGQREARRFGEKASAPK